MEPFRLCCGAMWYLGSHNLGQLPPAQDSGFYAWVPREGFLKILYWLSPLHGAGKESISPCSAQDVPRVFRDSGSSDGWLGSYCCNLHPSVSGLGQLCSPSFFSPNGKGGGCGERGSDINSYQGDRVGGWKCSLLPSVHTGGGECYPSRRGSWEAAVSVPLELPDVAEFTSSWGQRQAEVPEDSERTSGVSGPKPPTPPH